MAFAYSPKIVTDGLVFAVDAANTKSYPGSGTTWKDLSGNGNDGTLTNGPTFDSGNGGSIVFDGSDDRTDIANSNTLDITGSNITLSAWVNITSFGSAEAFIHKDRQYSIAFYPNGITYADSSRWSYNTFGFYGNFIINKWYHITATKNPSNIVTIYANNETVVSRPFYSAISSTSYDLNIGNYSDSYFFNGKISNVQIYNRALSVPEITQNYNALKSRFGL